MNPLFIIALIVVLPVVVFTVLRVHAAKAFFALALGSLLATYVTAAIVDFLRGYVAPDSLTVVAITGAVLLWLPVVTMIFLMGRTVGSRQRVVNALPGIGVGLVGVLLTIPLLTPDVQRAVYDTALWQGLKEYQALIVAASSIVSVVLLRMRAPFEEPHKHKKHHK